MACLCCGTRVGRKVGEDPAIAWEAGMVSALVVTAILADRGLRVRLCSLHQRLFDQHRRDVEADVLTRSVTG
jgi:hypothetical protein